MCLVEERGLQHSSWPVAEVELTVIPADMFVGADDAVSAADDQHVATGDGVGKGWVCMLVEGAGVAAPGRENPGHVQFGGREHPGSRFPEFRSPLVVFLATGRLAAELLAG